MPSDLARRRGLLIAALGFALVDTKDKPAAKEIALVREWLDTWKGIGHVVTGMARQDYDLELTQYDGRGWGRDVLRGRRGALADGPHGERVGADALARGPGGGLGGAHEARGDAADAGGGYPSAVNTA